MTVAVLCILIFPTLALTERGCDRLMFTAASFVALAGVMLLFVGDPVRAVLLAGILALAASGFSKVKHHHSGIKFRAADGALLFAGTLPFLVNQYRHAAWGVLAGAVGLAFAAVATVVLIEHPALQLDMRLVLAGVTLIACAFAHRAAGGAKAFRRIETQHGNYFATFMASLIDIAAWRPSRHLRMIDLSSGPPLDLNLAIPAASPVMPDIIVLQHESVFDPRLFGLPVEPHIREFLSPSQGISGTLHVDIYGGGSWQSEFSLLTGLSSASFGPDAYFIFKKGAGRFHHSLPRLLQDLGYQTVLASSCRRSFLDYEAFYRSSGIAEAIFADDRSMPLDVVAFEASNSDAIFLEAVHELFGNRVDHSTDPCFLYALTNSNHGPHDRRQVAPERFEAERTFALTSLPDAQYAEYYARLAETATTWARITTRLQAMSPRRPLMVVHYGDHQPVMTRRIESMRGLPKDPRRAFHTFFAIEAFNVEMCQSTVTLPPVLDIAFLGTATLAAAGLPLDRISATRASLIRDCGEAYFAAASERKHRFHRALVELGMIELGAGGQRQSPARHNDVAPLLDPARNFERRTKP